MFAEYGHTDACFMINDCYGKSRANYNTRDGLRMEMFSLTRRLIGDITVFEYL